MFNPENDIIRELPIAIYTCDTNGHILQYNKAAISLWGRTPEAGDLWCGSWKIFQLNGQPLAMELCPMALALQLGKPVPGHEIIIERMDGTRRHVKPHPVPLYDQEGKIKGAVNMLDDVTEQKRIESELILAKVYAEEEKIKAENAARIAEDAVKSKQQFLSNMSHEIRTPMNAIIGFTNVVLKTELTTNQKEYLTAIKVSGDALIVLINDILDLAKVDSGKMSFEEIPFKIFSSIAAMLHLFDSKVQEKNIKLVFDYDKKIPELVIGDPIRLHQIILNLVSNAVKFTSVGTITVVVKLLSEDEENVTIRFMVQDTGIGIEDDHIDHIFENFQQATSNTSRLYGGTGLGLAIVKKLVEAQGGNINVTTKVDEGSVFTFILNYQKTTEQLQFEDETIALDPSLKDIKVLVVEDMPLNQLLMKTVLDDFGFQNETASDGQEAVDKLSNASFDIVLMDLQMPVMNGFEATEHIRSKMQSKIPIIALTADVTTVDLAKCRAVGMDDYIAKPVDEIALYNKITTLIKKHKIKT